ncbi:hypothetical protein GCM10010508_59970 [Streptomyces naganishii JCM 4654]|uniref:Uncharacterized protein n=1 Tax=Streptomyces naganishii JCM 4654 TaxID=1306179 RepID=A0A918YAT6_9ACTN|nr:hypothetical protein GCM10010508_59970 [Streptomyces naganishii JCM 4654]
MNSSWSTTTPITSSVARGVTVTHLLAEGAEASVGVGVCHALHAAWRAVFAQVGHARTDVVHTFGDGGMVGRRE